MLLITVFLLTEVSPAYLCTHEQEMCLEANYEAYKSRSLPSIHKKDDKIVYTPKKIPKKQKVNMQEELLNDIIFWLETFTRPVSGLTGKGDAMKSLKAMMRMVFLLVKYDLGWSWKKNHSLVYHQAKEGGKKFQNFSWKFPLISALSHGGRINFLFENGKKNNFVDLVSFDNAQMELLSRDWSSHGFTQIDNGNFIETGGIKISAVNKLKESNIQKNTNLEKLGFQKINKSYRLHNYFNVPFGGAGNYFKTEKTLFSPSKDVPLTDMSKSPYSGHIYFRNGFEFADDPTKEIFLIGIENSPPSTSDFYGQSHGIMSVFTAGDRFSLTAGHKWGKYKEYKTPSTIGGKTVYITDTPENIKNLYKKADEVVEKLQNNDSDLERKVFKLFASEDLEVRKNIFEDIVSADNAKIFKTTFEEDSKDYDKNVTGKGDSEMSPADKEFCQNKTGICKNLYLETANFFYKPVKYLVNGVKKEFNVQKLHNFLNKFDKKKISEEYFESYTNCLQSFVGWMINIVISDYIHDQSKKSNVELDKKEIMESFNSDDNRLSNLLKENNIEIELPSFDSTATKILNFLPKVKKENFVERIPDSNSFFVMFGDEIIKCADNEEYIDEEEIANKLNGRENIIII